MVAINFTKFIDKVASGEKRMTIRKTARAKPGDKLQLYTGMRTKACRKLVKDDPVCTGVFAVTVSEDGVSYVGFHRIIHIGSLTDQCRYLAIADGFDSFKSMSAFFRDTYKELPFTGYAHVWDWPDAQSKDEVRKPTQ